MFLSKIVISTRHVQCIYMQKRHIETSSKMEISVINEPKCLFCFFFLSRPGLFLIPTFKRIRFFSISLFAFSNVCFK